MRFGPTKLPKKFFDDAEIKKMQHMYDQNYSISRIATNMARDKRLVDIYFKKPEFYQQLMDWKEKERLKEVRNKTISKQPKKKVINAATKQLILKKAKQESVGSKKPVVEMSYRNYMPTSLFTDDEEQHIMELRGKGFSLSQIGKIIGKDRRVISFFLNAPDLYAINKRGEKHNKPLKTHVKPIRNPLKTIATTPEKVKWKPTSVDYNKISMEYRAVIKFLTKKGLTPPDIYDDMLDIYGKLNFDIDCLTYWHDQYVMGRESLLNDPRVPEFYSPVKGKSSGNSSFVEIPDVKVEPECDEKISPDPVKFKIKFGFGKNKSKS